MKRTLILLSAAVLFWGCSAGLNAERALSGGAKALQAASITDAQVQEYVHQYIVQLDAQSKVLPESNAYTQRLRRLTKGITAVDGLPLNFKVYQTNEVNAFACADGSVRVYTGLMDMMTDDELLGVVGHEIGHVALKHSKKQMKQAILASALRDGIASTGTVAAVISDTGLGEIGEALMGAQYSQKQEFQADEFGYNFLKSSGRNPWAMAMAFEKLQSLSGGTTTGGKAATGSSVSQLFSTHPPTSDRIEKVSKKATADGYIRPSK